MSHVGLRELWQLPLPENRRYRRYNASSLAAQILSRGRRVFGWPGGERERRRYNEMERTQRMVDSARCCPLRVAELLLRQRVLATISPAARDSSSGSRYTMTGVSQRWYDLRSCRPSWITEGPGQRGVPRCAGSLSRQRMPCGSSWWFRMWSCRDRSHSCWRTAAACVVANSDQQTGRWRPARSARRRAIRNPDQLTR